MNPVLEVHNLGVAFGGIRAVNDVSFAAAPNAITTVIGPNGAGKSTLFNLISGLIRPHSGRVVLRGVDRTASPPHLMQRAGLGRSFQITNLFFELTVFENLRLAAQRLEPQSRFLLPVGRSDRALARVDERSSVSSLAPKPVSWPARCRMANSAGSRSRWRWRPSPRCCCSTSRPRA
jgi:branched-chain amino acid transport system ATP-binding protein